MSGKDCLFAVLLGVLEGVTEWLPISSTGHLILLADRLPIAWSVPFWELFLVVVQLGAILAVMVRLAPRMLPVSFSRNRLVLHKKNMVQWRRVFCACIPAVFVGVLFGEVLDELFYNPFTVGVSLVLLGTVFLFEKRITARVSIRYCDVGDITDATAFKIGLFQTIAAIFPGTSRSGITMFGGVCLGVSRTAATEFTFLVGVPVMFGAGLLKLWESGGCTQAEAQLLLVGAATAFLCSLAVIGGLLRYLKRGGLAVFGWYRIFLGAVVLMCEFL